jgi:formylglycine-generating enzyme
MSVKVLWVTTVLFGMVLAEVHAAPTTLTCSIGIKLVKIPAGEFWMGELDDGDNVPKDALPRHRVRITKPFCLGVYEVTVAQFRKFVEDTGFKTEAETQDQAIWPRTLPDGTQTTKPATWRDPGFEQADDHPVTSVSWNDAMAFCKWLSKKESREYRLPTEAEWEYACRAGSTTRYGSGETPETLEKTANTFDKSVRTAKVHQYATDINPWDDGFVFTAPVGHFRPNAWGVYDMLGNVGEWCNDYYHDGYYRQSPVDDPPGPASGTMRVHRGNSFGCQRPYCAERRYRANAMEDIGFRIALTDDGEKRASTAPPDKNESRVSDVEQLRNELATAKQRAERAESDLHAAKEAQQQITSELEAKLEKAAESSRELRAQVDSLRQQMMYQGVVTIYNPTNAHGGTIKYRLRWQAYNGQGFNGEWTDWQDGSVENGRHYGHWHESAVACEIGFDTGPATGHTIKTYRLNFIRVPTIDGKPESNDGAPYYFHYKDDGELDLLRLRK